MTDASVVLGTNKVFGDDVTTSFTSATFDDRNVGIGKTVTVSGIAIAGADAANYNLLNTTATDHRRHHGGHGHRPLHRREQGLRRR